MYQISFAADAQCLDRVISIHLRSSRIDAEFVLAHDVDLRENLDL